MSPEERAERIAKLEKQQRLGTLFGRAIAKRKRNLLDKLLVAIAMRMVKEDPTKEDFMRDEICDADIEFSPDELRSFREGS